MPSSRHARMIRTAISPRLAMSRRRKGGGGPSLRKDVAVPACSERDVAMLLSGICLALRLQHLEGSNHLWPGLGRPDDVVDIATGRGDVRVRELCLVRRNEPATLGRLVLGSGKLVLVDDVDRTVGAHDGDLGARPCEVDVAADVLAAHYVVRAAVGLSRDDGDLRDGCFA